MCIKGSDSKTPIQLSLKGQYDTTERDQFHATHELTYRQFLLPFSKLFFRSLRLTELGAINPDVPSLVRFP